MKRTAAGRLIVLHVAAVATAGVLAAAVMSNSASDDLADHGPSLTAQTK